MIEIIIIIAIVVLFAFAVKTVSNIVDNVDSLTKNTIPESNRCKQHDWYQVVDEDENDLGLMCIVCGQVPRMEQ